MMHRRMALVVALGVAVALLAVGYLASIFVPPQPLVAVHYSTLADALAAGMRERGWLPGLVPDSALDISEAHDVDSNISAGLFSYDSLDEAELTSEDRRIPAPCVVEIPKTKLGDWPPALQGKVTCEDVKRAGFVLSGYSDPPATRPRRHFVIAIQREKRRAAYWTVEVESMGTCEGAPKQVTDAEVRLRE